MPVSRNEVSLIGEPTAYKYFSRERHSYYFFFLLSMEKRSTKSRLFSHIVKKSTILHSKWTFLKTCCFKIPFLGKDITISYFAKTIRFIFLETFKKLKFISMILTPQYFIKHCIKHYGFG